MPEHRLERFDEFLFPAGDFADRIGEHFGGHFDLNLEPVAVVFPADDNLVVGRIALIEQHRFDLGRENR